MLKHSDRCHSVAVFAEPQKFHAVDYGAHEGRTLVMTPRLSIRVCICAAIVHMQRQDIHLAKMDDIFWKGLWG